MNAIFKQFPAVIQEVADSCNGLRQALKRLAEGSPETPRSWVYEDRSPEWILGSIEHKLAELKDLKNISDWDLSKSDKFGPQGGAAPFKDRLEVFDEYFSHLDSPQVIGDPIWTKAKELVRKRLGFNHSGAPTTSKAVIDRGLGEDKYGTSSGWPLYIKRKNPEAIQQVLSSGMSCFTEMYPFTVGSRATMGKTGKMARFIFMAPMAVNVQGQRFQQPLQDYLRRLTARGETFFLPWEGWDKVQLWISDRWPQHLKFGADYTKMDQHFNRHHGEEVFDVVKHFFNPKYWEDLHTAMIYPFIAPIITSEGYIFQDHAMASGSEWTNFEETMWNYIFCTYLEIKYHLSFERAGIGDDQLYFLPGEWTSRQQAWLLKTVITEMEYCGLPGNPAKQEESMDQTGFLQRLMVTNWNGLKNNIRAAGVYSLIRNITSQVYPERYHNEKAWDHNMFALRVIMICENCCNHPLFPWYCSFLLKSNSNIPEFVRLADSRIRYIEMKAKGIAGFLPTYNQEKQEKSILQFETLRLMREMV